MRVLTVKTKMWKKDPNRSAEKGPELIAKSSGEGGSTAIVHSTQLILKAARRGKLGKSDKKSQTRTACRWSCSLRARLHGSLTQTEARSRKPHLNKHVSVMWADTVPITEPLCGDDLAA